MKNSLFIIAITLLVIGCAKQPIDNWKSTKIGNTSTPPPTPITSHHIAYYLQADSTDTFHVYYTTDTGYVRYIVAGSTEAKITSNAPLLADIGVGMVKMPAGSSYSLILKVDGVVRNSWTISDTHDHCIAYQVN